MLEKFKFVLFNNISPRQTVVKNSFWLLVAEGINKLLTFFLVIVIARYLGAEDYGKFSFVFAFVALFAVISDLGLSTLTIREVARDRGIAQKYTANIVTMKLALGIIALGLIAGFLQFLGRSSSINRLVYFAAIWMIIQSFAQYFQSLFRAFEKMQYEALSKIIYSLLLLAAVFFVIRQDLGIEIMVQSYVYASLIALAVTAVLASRKFIGFGIEVDLGFWKKLFRESWMIGAIMYLITAYICVDQFLLAIFREYRDVGIYSIAYKFVMLIAAASFILMNSLFPTISKFKEKIRIVSFYNNNLKKIFWYAFFSCLFIFILSKPLIGLLFGEEYSLSFSVFKILVLAAFFEFFVFFGYICLLALEETKALLNYKLISAATNVCLNLLLIPAYGVYGAAVATVISYLELVVLNHITINRLADA